MSAENKNAEELMLAHNPGTITKWAMEGIPVAIRAVRLREARVKGFPSIAAMNADAMERDVAHQRNIYSQKTRNFINAAARAAARRARDASEVFLTDVATAHVAEAEAALALLKRQPIFSLYAPRRAPNPWILFTMQVDAALKAARISADKPSDTKMFASALKDMKPYAEWTDGDIVEAWQAWRIPKAKLKNNSNFKRNLNDFDAYILEKGALDAERNAKALRNENNARLQRIAAAAAPNVSRKNKPKPKWGIPDFGSSAMGGATRKKRRTRKN